METKPTPGPWRYAKQNPSPTTGAHMIAGGTPGYLAEVRDCGSGDVAANARLIAAAPDLLASVTELLSCIQPDRDWDEAKRARAAIKKATGSTP